LFYNLSDYYDQGNHEDNSGNYLVKIIKVICFAL